MHTKRTGNVLENELPMYLFVVEFGLTAKNFIWTYMFLISFTNSPASLVTLIGVIIFLYLEQGILVEQKKRLKDDYSHRIGNLLQMITMAGSSIKSHSEDKKLINSRSDLIIEKVSEAGELVNEIRNM